MTGDAGSNDQFRILICLDGSDEGYRGLRYAAKLGSGVTADICVLHLRSASTELPGDLGEIGPNSNLFDWGKKVPGVKYLQKGRELLTELGVMGDDWEMTCGHTPLENDPIGNNLVEFRDGSGKCVAFRHEVAVNVADGILHEIEACEIDLVILGASDRWRKGTVRSLWDAAVAEKVAKQATCSVLVARDLEIGHGHLLCTDGSKEAKDMVRKDAVLASRCQCSISLLSVALDEAGKREAQAHVDEAKAMLTEMGIEVLETMVCVGDPVHEIVEAGPDYSLIVLSASSTSALKQFFIGSTAFKVMEEAYNSVMIVR